MRSRIRYRRRDRCTHRIDLPKFKYYKKSQKGIDNLTILIGKIIVIIGIFIVLKNTMIYSGGGFSRGITLGTSCGLAFILLMIGVIINLCLKKSFVGWILMSIGITWLVVGILINLKMVFMPINSLKAIMIFGFIALGISIMIKGTFGRRR